jgi:hypothetical protein
MVGAARGIIAQRGVVGLYAGMGATLLEIIPHSGIQFAAYDLFKRAAVVNPPSSAPSPPRGREMKLTPAQSLSHECTGYAVKNCGVAHRFKGHSLSRRAKPYSSDS